MTRFRRIAWRWRSLAVLFGLGVLPRVVSAAASEVPSTGELLALAPERTEAVLVLRGDMGGADQAHHLAMLRSAATPWTVVISGAVDDPLLCNLMAAIRRAEPICYVEYGRDFRSSDHELRVGVLNYTRLSMWFTRQPLAELKGLLTASHGPGEARWGRRDEGAATYTAEITEVLTRRGAAQTVSEKRVLAFGSDHSLILGEDEREVVALLKALAARAAAPAERRRTLDDVRWRDASVLAVRSRDGGALGLPTGLNERRAVSFWRAGEATSMTGTKAALYELLARLEGVRHGEAPLPAGEEEKVVTIPLRGPMGRPEDDFMWVYSVYGVTVLV